MPRKFTLRALRAFARQFQAIWGFPRAQAPVQPPDQEADFAWEVMNALGQGVTITDVTRRFVYVNPAYARMVGRSPAEVLGLRPEDFTFPDDHDLLKDAYTRRQQGETGSYYTRLRHADGSEVFVQVTGTPRRRFGRTVGTFAVVTDLSEQRHHHQFLRQEAAYARALVNISQLAERAQEPITTAAQVTEVIARVGDVDWAGLLTVDGAVSRVCTVFDSQQGTQAFRRSVEQHPARRPVGMVWQAFDTQTSMYADLYSEMPHAAPQFIEAGVQSAAWIPVWRKEEQGLLFSLTRFGVPRPWTTRDRDLFEAAATTVRVAYERQEHVRALERVALEDVLTGVGNRRAYESVLAQLLTQMVPGQGLLLAVMDLNDFKQVNDQHGHAAGDALLRRFARALQSQVEPGVRVFRIGGDEFALMVPPGHAVAEAAVVSWVKQAEASAVDGAVGTVVSVGVACAPDDGQTPEALMRVADVRMYTRKRRRPT
ncbi:sensor domain-containing diguanylate cyclase [Deinococcus hohokamensis]|uniref:Diguanylate cyclase domain-containing protein n=1 Tax=Deinococcus hohokamensis TaxID=309883 RepID=A0ABV9ID66_9DEIO